MKGTTELRVQPADFGGFEGNYGRPDPDRWWSWCFGGLFLLGGVAHLLLVSLDHKAYDPFADGSPWPLIAGAWHSLMLPNVHLLVPASRPRSQP